ncbi:acyl-ACP--UDP-N-acetylglucosamine O-acyltransferase [Thermoflexibacter ruber]|uniref:Acyl-[acyl-carrier-protein]--UDP-N-acetylglucosamine O-acyltransferase n=1 Tax=Thermoflexibacter ruber TaxID=1003 RepID=A0A1I2F3D5_9BACT|nr:acyl-ACP--UDP-N-acetylglucosamine O-acyltransferase [Thermoflexibacter ruber]SFE99218.1 acyl-[acyl-carrier-protein]--UDP-N-acetylglucosamine O-acyltransferase [Thermoflexibacter ruber]
MLHHLAYIHPEAKIGANVTVEPFAYIEADVEIGEGTWIGAHAVIKNGSRIGKNCKIYYGAVISQIPQDLKYEGEQTLTIIGDNTAVREYATISCGTKDRFQTVIGKNCLIMSYAHIAHDCILGNNCIIVNSVQIAGHVVIDDFAVIGGTAAVQQFVRIGKHVMVGGGSLVRKDVPPFIKVAREPLSYVGLNLVGLKRRGFSSEKINELQEVYRTIYLKGYNNSQALHIIENSMPYSIERDEVLDFIKSSKRGIMPASRNGKNALNNGQADEDE